MTPVTVRRWAGALLAATLLGTTQLGGLSAAPALAADRPAFTPAVTVTPATGLDPAGTSITVKGTGFDPDANGGKGYGVRVGPAKADVRDRLGTGFQVAKLVKKDPQGTQLPLAADGSWELTVTVKAEYTSLGTTYNAKTQPFSVYVFGWDTPDLTWDRTTPLGFTGGGSDPGTGTAGLHWGVKQSWRGYISRFGGTITPSAGTTLDQAAPAAAPYPYTWPFTKSGYDPATGKGTVAFGGKVGFTLEPHQIWDFGFAAPEVTFRGDGTGTLSGTVGYSFYGTKDAPQQVRAPAPVVFAELKFAGAPRQQGDDVVADIASATLTEAGASAFAGFYKTGDALDAGQLVFPGQAGKPPTDPPTGPPTTPPTNTPPSSCVLQPGAVAQGNLVWGFKKSFRQYVGNGTGNSITASDGAVITSVDEVANSRLPSGAYRFALKSGRYTSAGGFTAQFGGKVTFSYPAHFFTLSLANPKIQVAQGKGTLYADAELATSTGAPSPPVSRPGVALATLDLTAARNEPGAGLLTVSGIKAVLNPTDVFADFYHGGEPADEPAVTLAADCAQLPAAGGTGGTGAGTGGGNDLVPDVAFRPGNLASTGATLAPLWWGAVLLLAGTGLVLFTRRSRKTS